MYGSYLRMGGKALLGGLLTALIATLTLAPVGVAQAATGTFEWCPAPALHDDAECVTGTSFQDAVLKAQAARVPGTIFVNAGTFTENVTATGLRDVKFRGNANSVGVTTINGSISIIKSKSIDIQGFSVTSGISVDGGSGKYLFYANTGPITVRNSKFDRIPSFGLSVHHGGDVSLMHVSASRNLFDGIIIRTSGNISLIDVTASKNGQLGANLESTAGTVTVTTSSSKMNKFDQNKSNGLGISSSGAITLVDVSASKNEKVGLNVSSESTIAIGTARSKGNRFDGNGLSGVRAEAVGDIALTDVSASKNGYEGLLVTSDAAVMINAGKSKMNRFDKNGLSGVHVDAGGNVIFTDGSANQNGGNGADFEGGSVTISAYKAKSLHFDKNTYIGVRLTSSSVAILADSNASQNGGSGASLTGPEGVTVYTYLSKLSRFEKNGGNGLNATSNGLIYVRDVSANRNTSTGMHLESDSDVMVETDHAAINSFDQNREHGLSISASGVITLKDASASKNLKSGAYLISGSAVSVSTLHAKMNKFDGNTENGIFSSSASTVTVARTSAGKNQERGLYLVAPENAEVTCSAVNKNTGKDIRASLGTADLLLSSVTLTHPGLVDVDFMGSGVIIVSTAMCS